MNLHNPSPCVRLKLLCLVLLNLRHFASSKNFTDHPTSVQVLRIYIDSEEKVNALRNLQQQYHLDPWRGASVSAGFGDYVVPGGNLNDLLEDLHTQGLHYEVTLHDVYRYIRDNDPLHHVFRRKRSSAIEDFRYKFLPYDEILRYLYQIQQSSARTAQVQVGSLGNSYEGRLTPFVKISARSNTTPKKMIFIDGGVHSREWISPAIVLEMIHRLAINTENDTTVNSLLSHFDWILVPLVNPDGYQYTFHPQPARRLWRKSRATNHTPFPQCYGVDLNRNFGFQWNDSPLSGGSSDPCSGTYSGPHSFSEPETRNLRDLLLRYKDAVASYLTFHSFGQFFLYPWGFSSDVSIQDERDLHDAANAFAETMKKKNYNYNVGGSAKTLYPASGASDDYVRGTVGVKYAYTIELPPHSTSAYGFLLPEADVRDVVTDTWQGLKDFFSHLQTREEMRQEPKGISTGQTFVR